MNNQQRTINRIIFVLSILGVIMAAYVLQSFLRNTGIVCLTGTGCELVRRSPISYPFGIPVPAFGLVGYTGLAILSFLRTLSHPQTLNSKLLYVMLGIAIFGICFVSWFTIMELFVIRGVCSWCAISAVNMYLIFCLVLKSLTIKNK
ncbi:vitamin K epoxide reductase family protein [Patescibacteria group bacterium]|nr:vitamin K epoxide reductase family protein [Patescibacteria group bacterium]